MPFSEDIRPDVRVTCHDPITIEMHNQGPGITRRRSEILPYAIITVKLKPRLRRPVSGGLCFSRDSPMQPLKMKRRLRISHLFAAWHTYLLSVR